MITDHGTKKVISGGAKVDSANYHINPDNIVHITQILRNMYSDPELAVVREYTSNAIDAHVMAGTEEKIRLHLPTTAEPWFSVRDFGGGLSVEDTKELLYGFGSSGEHKRTSNEQIGGFGIGCKCAFAVTDNFTYTVWKDGMKRVWNCFLDEDDMGKADLMLSQEDAANLPGIEVRIPVDAHSSYKYEDAVRRVFQYLDVRPAFDGDLETEIPEPPKPIFEIAVDMSINDRKAECKIKFVDGITTTLILGGAAYEVDLSQIRFESSDELSRRNRDALINKLLIDVPIGLVQVAPNREELQYSPRTKKVIAKMIELATSKQMVDTITTSVCAGAATYREKAERLALIGVRSSDDDWFQGGRLTLPKGTSIQDHKMTMSSWSYYEASPNRFTKLEDYDIEETGIQIPATNKGNTVFVLCEKELPTSAKGIRYAEAITKLHRDAHNGDLTALFMRDKMTRSYRASGRLNVRFLLEATAKTIPWLQDGSITTYKEGDLPDMKDVDVTWMRSTRRRSYGTSTAGSYAPTRYSQHGKKFVRLGREYESGRASSNWVGCKAKDIDEGIYTVIEGYRIVSPLGNGVYTDSYTNNMQSVINPPMLKEDEAPFYADILPRLAVSGLLGVKKAPAMTLDTSKFTTLWGYITERFNEDMADGKIHADGFMLRTWEERMKLPSGTNHNAQRFKYLRQYLRNLTTATETDEDVRGLAIKLRRDMEASSKEHTLSWAKFIAQLGLAMGAPIFTVTSTLDLDVSSGARFPWWEACAKKRLSAANALALHWRGRPAHETDTFKQFKTVLTANIPLVAFCGIFELFHESCGDLADLYMWDEVRKDTMSRELKVQDQVEKFLDMPESYSIMDRNKQEGDK